MAPQKNNTHRYQSDISSCRRRCHKYWGKPKYLGGKVVILDESMGVSQLLGARVRAAPKVYAYECYSCFSSCLSSLRRAFLRSACFRKHFELEHTSATWGYGCPIIKVLQLYDGCIDRPISRLTFLVKLCYTVTGRVLLKGLIATLQGRSAFENGSGLCAKYKIAEFIFYM